MKNIEGLEGNVNKFVVEEKTELLNDDSMNVNPQVLDNDEELESNFSSKKGSLFVKTLVLLNAIVFLCVAYTYLFTWRPHKRVFCDDNIFCGNELNISDDELEQITEILEKELGVCIDDECRDEYALLHAVYENEHLTDKEKLIFYKFIDIIKDNKYIDRESAYKSLRNVEVCYKKRPYAYNKNVQGVYSHIYESIGIFDNDEDNSILEHEGIHAIFDNEKTSVLPEYFKEGMTELLANEYFQERPCMELRTYPFEIAAIKMLCEVTSSDTVLKAFSLGDMDVIAQDMATITGDIDMARLALNSLDKIFLKSYDKLDGDVSYQELANECIPVFRGIITSKYEESAKNRISYFYNEILFGNLLEDNAYDNYIDDIMEFGIDYKAYFSSKLKKDFAAQMLASKASGEGTKVYNK